MKGIKSNLKHFLLIINLKKKQVYQMQSTKQLISNSSIFNCLFLFIKDAIFDIFDKTGSFAETDEIKKHYIKKNNYDLFVACFWIVVIALPSVYCLLLYFVNGSWIAKLTLIGIFALGIRLTSIFSYFLNVSNLNANHF